MAVSSPSARLRQAEVRRALSRSSRGCARIAPRRIPVPMRRLAGLAAVWPSRTLLCLRGSGRFPFLPGGPGRFWQVAMRRGCLRALAPGYLSAGPPLHSRVLTERLCAHHPRGPASSRPTWPTHVAAPGRASYQLWPGGPPLAAAKNPSEVAALCCASLRY